MVVGSSGRVKSPKKIEEDLPQQLNLIKFPYKELEAAKAFFFGLVAIEIFTLLSPICTPG